MPVRKIICYRSQMRRSHIICKAMSKGITATGGRGKVRDAREYRHPVADVAVHYGLSGNLFKVWKDHQTDGRYSVYIDLGYWGRRKGGRWYGYHKVVVNGRHPTKYFQNRKHEHNRFRLFRKPVKEWRQGGDAVMVAGMSAKAAAVEGFKYLEWERNAVKRLRQHTDRPIIYRPKPGRHHGTEPIKGTIHSPREEKLEHLLTRCHAVVTHHSNVAIDALIEGVPAFCEEGVAKPMSLNCGTDLSRIEYPYYPEDRHQWLADIAWCQFSVEEMETGVVWRHLLDEGLIE